MGKKQCKNKLAMKRREVRQLHDLKENLKKMYSIISSVRFRGYSYAEAELLDILDFIDIQLNKSGAELTYEEIRSIIASHYKSMFPAKAGLSEFHIWHENEEIRIRENTKYGEVREKVEKILKII